MLSCQRTPERLLRSGTRNKVERQQTTKPKQHYRLRSGYGADVNDVLALLRVNDVLLPLESITLVGLTYRAAETPKAD